MDAELKEDIQKTVQSVLGTFTTEYTKAYTLSMVNMKVDKILNEAEPRQLQRRAPSTEDVKAGYLTKEGAIRKNWKKRWFVIKANYTVEYWAKEEAASDGKSKPKGVFSPAGYKVVTDLGNQLLERTKDLAAKMGMDVDKLPKPKEYPPHTLELYHSNRRCYYISFEKEADKDEWADAFREACRKCRGLSKDDEYHLKAFPRAVRETRWAMGRWGYWGGRGSEEQVLTDVISDELEYDVMGRVYSKIPSGAPWMVRNKIRNKARSFIDGVVSGAVKPAWQAMWTAVEKLRPELEPKIDEQVQPVADQKRSIREKMAESATGQIQPKFDEVAGEHLGKLVSIFSEGVTGATAAVATVFDKLVTEYAKEPGADAGKKLDRECRWSSTTWEARSHLREGHINTLLELAQFVPGLRPWPVIYEGEDRINQLLDDACYTFKLEAEAEGGSPDAAKASVTEKLAHDAALVKKNFIKDAVLMCLRPPLDKLAMPLAKEICAPLEAVIPDPLKTFLDPMEEFSLLIDRIIGDAALKDQ